MRTIVYVDGFNLYYGSVKNTSYKWLDLLSLFRKVAGQSRQVVAIKYFTSRVSSTPRDPTKAERQRIYLRALQTLPEVSIHFGHFVTHDVYAPLARPTETQASALIRRTEEKGTDVNLAVHLLNDAWHDRYDCAMVASNDGDLAEAIRLAKYETGKSVGIAVPGPNRPSQALQGQADFTRRIRAGALASSLLPDPIPDTTIAKPPNW